MDLMELLEDCPKDEIIGDNLVKAYSKINSVLYKKIVCTVSGGYDSDIVVDICVKCDQNKKIEYVWFDTGLEYEATKEHLRELEKKYGIKIKAKKTKKPIPVTCKQEGLPFLSKNVSEFIERLQRHNFKWENKGFEELLAEYPKCKAALKWWCNEWGEDISFNIKKHKYLKEYMIANPPDFKISPKCCKGAKKDVLHETIKEGNYELNITGMRKAEGGVRSKRYSSCFKENEGGCDMYMPIWWYLKETKEKYKDHYGVTCSKCYSVYGLKRTGCAGCPFGIGFEQELEIMSKYEPKLYKAATAIFAESYRYTKNYHRYVAFMEET